MNSTQAAILLLFFASLISAAMPPTFPGQGTELQLQFVSSEAIPAGSIAYLSLECQLESGSANFSTAVAVGSDSSSLLYTQCSPPLTLSAKVDDSSTPASVDFFSNDVRIDSPDAQVRVRLIPAGAVTGFTALQGGEAIRANVTVKCAGQSETYYTESASNGTFQFTLPAGVCDISASSGTKSANQTVTIARGEVSSASLFLSEKAAPQVLPGSDNLLTAVLLLAAAIFILALVLAAYLLKGFIRKKGGKKGGKHAVAIAALLLLASLNSAATVSNSTQGSEHTYDLVGQIGYAPDAKQVLISGAFTSNSCTGTVKVEISDDNIHFAEIGSAAPSGGSEFRLQLANPGARRYYRISASPCTLSRTSISFDEAPDLTISSLNISSSDPSGEIRTGVQATITTVVFNAGGAFNESTTQSISVKVYEGAIDPARMIANIQITPGEQAWEEHGTAQKSTPWIPSTTGPRTIYAVVDDTPDTQGLESSEDNNAAQLGIFVSPGPSESRETMLTIAADPLTVALPGGSVALNAQYTDTLTNQPIFAANCTASAPAFVLGEAQLEQAGAGYSSSFDTSALGVGVYSFTISCSKDGYAPARASGYIPFNTPGGYVVELDTAGGAAHGLIITSKQAYSSPRRLRVIIERMSPEDVGISESTVRINNYQGLSLTTDAIPSEGMRWLKGNATSAEWLFEFSRISGDTLSVAFDPVLRGHAEGSQARLSVRLVPVGGACAHTIPDIFITPTLQSGESGTALYYQVTVTNKDAPDCGEGTFSFSIGENRTDWKYEFSSARIQVAPGAANSTFLIVTPRAGESPGTYSFRVEAQREADQPSQEPMPRVRTDAAYSVSSPRLRALLEVGIEGTSPVTVTAKYTDSAMGPIGSCRIASPLVGGKTIEMPSGGNNFSLSIPANAFTQGAYQYVVSCEAQGYNTKAFSGNIVITNGSASKAPRMSIGPAAQSPPPGGLASFSLKVSPVGCSSERISLSVTPPMGFEASLDRDSVPGCGESIVTVRTTAPATARTEPVWGSVTARMSGAPLAVGRFVINPPGIRTTTASCAAGAASESDSNLAFTGDPCWNWDESHTYYVEASPSDTVMVTGKAYISNCAKPIFVETGTSEGFAAPEQFQQEPSGQFNYTFTGKTASIIRISSKCTLEYSAVTVAKPRQSYAPELSIASAAFSARMSQGETETATIVVRNTGTSLYSSYSVSAGFIDSAGTKSTLGTATVYSHAGGTDQVAELSFTPPNSGFYTLFFAVDPAGEIPEEDESNNLLTIGDADVTGSGGRLRATRDLQPGWNLVPFAADAAYSHTCMLSDAYAFSPGQPPRHIQLETSSLGIISQGEAGSFISAHGTSARPKTAAAIGGAWLLSSAGCSLTFDSTQPGKGWRSVSPGFNLIAVLPADEGNTIGNVAAGCSLQGIYAWDADSQRWLSLSNSTVLKEEDIGSVLLLQTASACSLR